MAGPSMVQPADAIAFGPAGSPITEELGRQATSTDSAVTSPP